MKLKPKDIQVNLPIALLFDQENEINNFATSVNMIVHGKVKLKSENLGKLGNKFVGLFYMQRNNESQSIREEFLRLINIQEVGYNPSDKEYNTNLKEKKYQFNIKDDNLMLEEYILAEKIDGCFEFVDSETLDELVDLNDILEQAEQYLTIGKHSFR